MKSIKRDQAALMGIVEEETYMELLEQCQKWHENDEHQKIIDALEAIPAEQRTPDMDMELARATTIRPVP